MHFVDAKYMHVLCNEVHRTKYIYKAKYMHKVHAPCRCKVHACTSHRSASHKVHVLCTCARPVDHRCVDRAMYFDVPSVGVPSTGRCSMHFEHRAHRCTNEEVDALEMKQSMQVNASLSLCIDLHKAHRPVQGCTESFRNVLFARMESKASPCARIASVK
jgi:hypothetical protein